MTMVADGRWNYVYDAENRLSALVTTDEAHSAGVPRQSIAFGYDSENRRIGKIVYDYNASGNGTWVLTQAIKYLYDGWNLLAEINAMPANLTVVRTYAWGPDLSGTTQGAGGVGGLLMANLNDGNSTTKTVYYGYDGNGDVITMADTSGNVVASYDYDPFGNTVRATGSWAAFNCFRFGTEYLETSGTYAGHDTGLYNNKNRYYIPALGRFLNHDPIGENGGPNIYAYCMNDGINYFDAMGLNLYAIDGTGNDENSQTNVLKFYKRYLDGPSNYYRGPGNPIDGNLLFGSGWGAGSAGIVKTVLAQICKDYAADKNLKVDLVGFSRGAAVANEVASSMNSKAWPKVRFLGLFDPVYSFPVIDNWSWNKSITPNVQNASIAFSNDEARKTMRATLLIPDDYKATNYNAQWFPGVHSDVGGSIDRNPYIGALTLRWMVEQAVHAGVKMDTKGLITDGQIKLAIEFGLFTPSSNSDTSAGTRMFGSDK